MAEAEQYEKIEDYLKGRLTEDERSSFEEQMGADSALALEVDLFRNLIEATKESGVIAFEQQIQNIFAETSSEHIDANPSSVSKQNNNRSNLRRWILGLIVLTFATVIIWSVIQSSGESKEPLSSDPQSEINETEDLEKKQIEETQNHQIDQNLNEIELTPTIPEDKKENRNPSTTTTKPIAKEENKNESYRLIAMAEYDTQEISPIITKGSQDTNDEEKSRLAIAWQAYQKGDYAEVAKLLANPPESNLSEWIYLRGHAHFRNEQFQLAAEDFAQLTESFTFGYDADWYYLLSLAAQLPQKLNDFSEQLEKVTNDQHPFVIKAKELKSKLGIED